MIKIRFNPDLYDDKKLRQISDTEYAILIGKYGRDFLTYYLNKGDPSDSKYQRRVKNIYTTREINGDVFTFIDEKPQEIRQFKELDKLKLIDVMGMDIFVEKFYFPITIDMINCSNGLMEYDYKNPPEYLVCLDNNPNRGYLFLMSDLIKDYFHQIKKTKDFIFTIWDELNLSYRKDNNGGAQYKYFDFVTHTEIKRCELNRVRQDDLSNILKLMEMTKQLEKVIHHITQDIGMELHDIPFYEKYLILINDTGYKDIRGKLKRDIIKVVLDNYIYFYNRNKREDMRSTALLRVPLFYKESSYRHPDKDSYYEYIIRGASNYV